MKYKKINKLKKIYRITSKFLSFLIINLLAPIARKFGYNISPSLDKVNIFDYNYPGDTNRLVFRKNKDSFNKILIDLSLSNSNLCNLGKKFSANKSPINLRGHRASYTALYDLLFNQMKNKKIALAEIGIAENSSIKMWRNFFSKATIHGFELYDNLIKKAKKDKLQNTRYHKIDVNNESSINNSFKKTKTKFDIIIDDSTHFFDDQIKIIKNCHKYLNSRGILIIEDIYKFQNKHNVPFVKNKHSEQNYYNNLRGIKKYFYDIMFIEIDHVNNFTASWKCEKILLLIKK